MNVDLPVPMLAMDEKNSSEHLKLLLERVVHLLKRIASEPALFMDGRHQQDAYDAISALDKRITAANGWTTLLNDPTEASTRKAMLEQHGLIGPEFSLKYHAFDQRFQSFLDRMAALEWHTQIIEAKLQNIEVQDFAKKVRGPGKSARAALGIAEPIIESAAEAIPFAKDVLGALKEMSGVFGGLIQAKHG
jgi:hypothetical protein